MVDPQVRKEIQQEFASVVETKSQKGENEFTRVTIAKLLRIMTDRLNLRPAQDEEVSDLFRELDINGNGKLSKEQIKVFTKQLMDIVVNYVSSEVKNPKQ